MYSDHVMGDFTKRVGRKGRRRVGTLDEYASQWPANRRRLADAGYAAPPRVRIRLDGARVAVIEDRTGLAVGVLPPCIVDPKTGKELDLADPMTIADEATTQAWLLSAWYYLTGEHPVESN